jgi:hypothetical protein
MIKIMNLLFHFRSRLFCGCGCVGVLLLASATGRAVAEQPDLRGYWRMDDGVGLAIADSSGNGNNGSVRSVRWTGGVHNAAAQLNREGIHCGNDSSLNLTDAISIDAWVKPWSPRYPEQPTILRKEGAYALHLGPKKAATFSLWLDDQKESVSADLTDWPNGQWRHIAGTFDGRTMKIYINGKLDSEKWFAEGKKISTNSSPLEIGASRKRKLFSGTLDEVRIAAHAFSPEEVISTFRDGMFDVSRKNNIFTSFYEKYDKRNPTPLVPGTLWIDAEDFHDYGGWWMDTQFAPRMGSPFLIAAGLGTPVDNATTTVTIPEAGEYRLWVRAKNWLANGHSPGKFNVQVNGKKSDTVFGMNEKREWVWEDGGTFQLSEGETKIELEDITGYYGRCDAMILSKDPDFVPKQKQEDYLAMRDLHVEKLPVKEMGHFDFIVVGAGAAGCNAAIAAARGGAKVALIQDRPMVGGNNSSEMGVPISGGSSSGKGRETGLNEEIGRISAYNYETKWASGAEHVLAAEPNITVFLNSHVFKAETDANQRITAVTAFDMIDGHHTRYTGDYFADCTGDGWLGYYAGAEYMLGRETKEMFGEEHAKDEADNITMSGSLMQNAILGYQAIDMGEPIQFDAPEWVYDLRENGDSYMKRPKPENGIRAGNWWHENYGEMDDLWDPEWARDDLILVSMSYYNWIKNHSPLAEKAANYQLTYIPITNAKRETRRLVGDHVLVEQEVVNREVFPDRVGYFVWMLDIHHPRGIFSNEGPFDFDVKISPASIPFRILYSKDIPNMLMAGRNISVTHVTLGTARVQGTTGMMGQIIGTAAAMCVKKKITPRAIYQSHVPELQQQLMKDDITILHLGNEDPGDFARTASVTASSSMSANDGPENAINGIVRPLDDNMEMWIGKVPNNMWISDPDQSLPQWLELDLGEAKSFNSIYLTFDTNLNNKRYRSWKFTPDERMPPECARDYRVQFHDGSDWLTVVEAKDNYQRRRIHTFDEVESSKLRVLVDKTNGDPSARIYEVRVYNETTAEN